MFCSKCGKKIEEGAKFCINCGSPVEKMEPVQKVEPVQEMQPVKAEVTATELKPEPAQPEPEPAQPEPASQQEPEAVQPQPSPAKKEPAASNEGRRKRSHSNIALIGILGLGLIVAIAALVLKLTIGSRSSATCFTESQITLNMLEFADGDKITLFTGSGDAVVFEVSDLSNGDMNLDCSKLALVDEDQVLYYADKDGLIEVADHVVDIKMSGDGNVIAYTVSEAGANQLSLYVYDREKKSKTLIAENASSRGFAVSPNGQTIAYIGDYVSEEDFSLYLSIDGESEKVGNTKSPLAVSDHGKYLYFVDEGRLYVKKGEDAEKLSSDFGYVYLLNQDYSEIVFNDGFQCYISKKGNPKKEFLSEEYTQILLPSNVAYKEDVMLGGIVCGVESLTGYLYQANDAVFYVDDKMNNIKVYDGYMSYHVVSESNDSVLFTKDESLYKIKDYTGKTQPQLLGENLGIRTFITNGDNSYVYYLNIDDELMYQKGTSDPKKIADDVEYENCMFDQYDEVVYFISDADVSDIGQVYYSEAGSKKKKVKDMEEVRIASMLGRVYVDLEKDGGHTLYLLKNKKPYELLKDIVE